MIFLFYFLNKHIKIKKHIKNIFHIFFKKKTFKKNRLKSKDKHSLHYP